MPKLHKGTRAVLSGGAVVAVLAVAACAPSGTYATRDALVAPVNCSNQTVEVYFTEGQSSLTPTALQALSMTRNLLSDCAIRKVAVTGLSDASGGAAVNQQLSEQRAQAVRDALASFGWPIPVFEVDAVGSEGARTGNVNEPLRRRTVVNIEAEPRR